MYKNYEDQLKQQRKHYQNHKPYYLRRNAKRKSELRKFANSHKTQCVLCGETRTPCLDFHHPGDKDDCICKLIDRGYSKERLLVEIKKCVVLCSNCHRVHHASVAEGKDLEPIGRGPMLSE